MLGINSVRSKRLSGREDCGVPIRNTIPFGLLDGDLYEPMIDCWQGNTVHCSIHSKASRAERGREAFLTTVTKNSCRTWADVPKFSDSRRLRAFARFHSSRPDPTAA